MSAGISRKTRDDDVSDHPLPCFTTYLRWKHAVIASDMLVSCSFSERVLTEILSRIFILLHTPSSKASKVARELRR